MGGVELEYEVSGPRSGVPLLLIGGLGSQLVSWDDEFCALLVARGYRVVRFDNRDSGLSTMLDEAGAPDLLGILVGGSAPPYTLDDLAADAVGLLDALGLESAHVVGISMGGMVAQLMALANPGRVRTVVALLSGPPGRPAELPDPAVVDALLRPPAPGFDGRVAAAVELRRVLANGGIGFDPEQARLRARAQLARASSGDGALRQAAAVLGTPNRLADLERLRVPVLVAHGDLDPLIRCSAAAAAAAAIPAGTFLHLAGVGHDLPASVALDLLDRMSAFHEEADGAAATTTPAPGGIS